MRKSCAKSHAWFWEFWVAVGRRLPRLGQGRGGKEHQGGKWNGPEKEQEGEKPGKGWVLVLVLQGASPGNGRIPGREAEPECSPKASQVGLRVGGQSRWAGASTHGRVPEDRITLVEPPKIGSKVMRNACAVNITP